MVSRLDYRDGGTALVEQKSCAISNLMVTVDRAALPEAATLRRMAEVVSATPLWRTHFANLDAAAVIGRAYALARQGDTVALDLPPASGGVSDALLTREADRLIVTLSVGDEPSPD